MSFVCARVLSICTRMPFVCHWYVLVWIRMSSVCHSYVLACHPYVTRMSIVCTRMSSVYHSYVLVCHSYVTRLWFYHEPYFSSIPISTLQHYRNLYWHILSLCSIFTIQNPIVLKFDVILE